MTLTTSAPSLPLADELPAESSKPRGKYVRSLDGIRALAVLAVMAHHFGFPGGEVGWLGVDMFFVLSGFLITTLLCRERDATGTVSLPKFWLRRACRLLPVYWIYVSVVTGLVLARHAGDWTAQGPWTPGLFIASLWGYFVNLAPGGLWSKQQVTWHLWSLSIEEQFYFCWPFICLMSMKLRRPWLVPLVALVPLVIYFAIPVKNPGAVHSSYIRTEGIITGCTFALLFHFAREGRVTKTFGTVAGRNIAAVGWVGLLALGYVAIKWGVHHPQLNVRKDIEMWLVPPFVIAFSCFVAGLWYGPGDVVSRLLAWQPLVYIGRISYGVYLYHIICLTWIKNSGPAIHARFGFTPRFWMLWIAYVAVVLGLASLSYYVIERPFLRFKERLSPERKTIAA